MTLGKQTGIILGTVTQLKIIYFIVVVLKNVLTTTNPVGHFSGSSMTFIDIIGLSSGSVLYTCCIMLQYGFFMTVVTDSRTLRFFEDT